ANDSARMKPASLFEDPVPVDIAGFQLRHGRVPAIRASQRRTYSEASLGEIEAIANRAPDAVVRNPANQRRIHAALINEVLNQPANRIVGECSDDRRVHSEAAL